MNPAISLLNLPPDVQRIIQSYHLFNLRNGRFKALNGEYRSTFKTKRCGCSKFCTVLTYADDENFEVANWRHRFTAMSCVYPFDSIKRCAALPKNYL